MVHNITRGELQAMVDEHEKIDTLEEAFQAAKDIGHPNPLNTTNAARERLGLDPIPTSDGTDTSTITAQSGTSSASTGTAGETASAVTETAQSAAQSVTETVSGSKLVVVGALVLAAMLVFD